jgi:hypothetical protein
MAGVVFVSASAGSFAAARAELEPLAAPAQQALHGAWLACAWLGVVTLVYASLRRSGRVRVAAELTGRAQVLAGLDRREALSMAAQSAIGEETMFRLLGISLLLLATGHAWLAVGLTAILWSATHSGGAFIPRWTRLLELAVVGCVLGAAFVTWGFVAVVVAHFLYNFVFAMPPLRVAPAPVSA